MGGGGFDEFWVQGTGDQSQKQLEMTQFSSQADIDIGKEQSEAVKYQADADKEIRMFEALERSKVEMEALRIREKEADLQFRADMKQAEVDAMRAMAMQTAADAKVTTADSRMTREKRKAERDQRRDDSAGLNSFYYG